MVGASLPRSPAGQRATFSIVARSVVFTLGQALATLVFTTLALAAWVLPLRWRYRVVVQWTFFNTWWLARICRLSHVVEGVENIPATPSVVLCKHQSAWETVTLQRYFSPQVWVIKRELLRVPVFGWGLATLEPIAIDRAVGRAAVDQILDQGRDRLDKGFWVVVFPEGTRVPAGRRGRYRRGGAALAKSTGRDVVPVAHNSGDYWPRRSFLKYPGVIRLVIGPPIEVEGRTVGEINSLAEEWIESTVRRLRRPYAENVDDEDDAIDRGHADQLR